MYHSTLSMAVMTMIRFYHCELPSSHVGSMWMCHEDPVEPLKNILEGRDCQLRRTDVRAGDPPLELKLDNINESCGTIIRQQKR
jgi:hypothetical protein